MSFGYFVNYVLGASLSYHFDPWLPPLDVYAMQVDAPFYFSFVLPYMLILVAFEKQTSALVDQANVQSRQLNAQTKTIILLAVLAGALLKVTPSDFAFTCISRLCGGLFNTCLPKRTIAYSTSTFGSGWLFSGLCSTVLRRAYFTTSSSWAYS